MLWILLNIYPSSGHLVKKKTSNRDCILGWLKSSCGFSAPSYRNFWASFFADACRGNRGTSFTLFMAERLPFEHTSAVVFWLKSASSCPVWSSVWWPQEEAQLHSGGRAVPPLRVGLPSPARGGSVSPRLPAAGPRSPAVKAPATDRSLSRKRTCHFKFSAGNWHFIIYVVHVIMLDNITNDAIRSTGNLKWCTPVLTWERSGAHIQPPQLKASSRQRLCPELCSQTDG